jgi:DNA-binding MarR family transcriptional regulator
MQSQDRPGAQASAAIPDNPGIPAGHAAREGTPALADDPALAGGQVVATWRAITASHAAANAALDHEFSHLGLGVSEFEVLDRLSESPEHKFRAQELADAVHLSQSALSRLIDRLVKNGLVERCLCGEDRRGIYVLLTPAGLRRHAEAASVHRDVLARVLPPALVQCQCTDTVPA